MGTVDLVRLALATAAAAGGPSTPQGYADALEQVRPAQRAAARAWDGRRPVPDDLAAHALSEQRMVLDLAASKSLRKQVIPLLDDRERGGVRDEVRAQVDLNTLAHGWPVKRHYKTGRAASAKRLWRFYGPVSYTHLTLPTNREV